MAPIALNYHLKVHAKVSSVPYHIYIINYADVMQFVQLHNEVKQLHS